MLNVVSGDGDIVLVLSADDVKKRVDCEYP